MVEAIKLCRIAYKHYNDMDAKTFEYNNELWKPFDFMLSSRRVTVKQIVSEISGTNILKRILAIKQVQEDAEKYLDIYYVNAPISKRNWMEITAVQKRFFPILFKNFTTLPNISFDIGEFSKVVKKYVTTSLYDALNKKHLSNRIHSDALQIPQRLVPKLCDYQQQAVEWLYDRECRSKSLPDLYVKLIAYDNSTCVYSHKLHLHIMEQEPKNIILPPGGILADEMGLGKTVEMLALILLHPRTDYIDFSKDSLAYVVAKEAEQTINQVYCLCGIATLRASHDGNIKCEKCALWQHSKCVCKFDKGHGEDINNPYLCPKCWTDVTDVELVKSGATLIISPNTIRLQWLSEIHKHVHPSLRVFVYNGIAKNWIGPRQLANYDVVLTDYNVLRNEIHHSADNCSQRTTRSKPRFMRRNTPLLMIEWWRVCLDEAQMVESNTSMSAKLAFQLPAINRWAVTGTPIQNSIDDLLALLTFVGLGAICHPRIIWNNLVHDYLSRVNNGSEAPSSADGNESGSPLIDLLHLCMWRTCKSKVNDQLSIPPQLEEIHFVRLGDIEKLFYSEQHADCKENFDKTFNRCLDRAQKNLVAAEISPHIMKTLLEPLLRIRQCCTLPVIETGPKTYQNNQTAQKKFLQPKDLHSHLKALNEIECKSELRSIASSHNGMAAIYFIREKYEQAIYHYEMVLELARNYNKQNLSVDSLLQIHALHNLIEAHSSANHDAKLSPIDIKRYEDLCNTLEWKYLEPYASTMKRVQTAFETESDVFTIITSQTETNVLKLLSEIVGEILADVEHLHNPLMDKIFEECVQAFPNCQKIIDATSVNTLLYIIANWNDKVIAMKSDLSEKFTNLKFFTDNVLSRDQVRPEIWTRIMIFVNEVYNCHLMDVRSDKDGRPGPKRKKKKNPCSLCMIQNILNAFECLLFNKVVDEKTNVTEGLAVPSPEVALIKSIFNFVKTKAKLAKFAVECEKQWKLISCMQAMWKKMLKFWIEIEYTVKAYDELNMCKMRISLTTNDNDKSNFKLLEHEVDDTFVEQQLNYQAAQRQFDVKYARLKYILHLEKSADSGPCPICQSEENSQFAVLECGHQICIFCLKTLTQISKSKNLICSICRNQQHSTRIYYVTRSNDQELCEFDVKGHYSSKISFIVKKILKLRKESDPETPKILIFSQWQPVLLAIAEALSDNGISYRSKWSPQSIADFKNPELNIMCMLMVLSKGSKGLNLIEATHVFLVEPILNPAEELQAIGRVHRFGQTRSTKVHRFIVLNTIEENIHSTINKSREMCANWQFDNMSLESLRNLFTLTNDVSHDC